MNEVGLKSMSDAGFNQDNLTNQFNSQYSIIPENSFLNHNGYKKSSIDTKEMVNLKKTVNRLERNISFIQQEHCQMLKSLQNQVERLREENQELQFQVVMKSDHINDNEESKFQVKSDNLNGDVTNIDSHESQSHQISKLKEAIEKEREKNSDLILKLGILTMGKTEDKSELSEVMQIANQDLPGETNLYDEIDITPNIRISLDPLTLSLFHEDSGQYIRNPSPTTEDCELIIRALLEKSKYRIFKTSGESSLRSLSGQRSVVPDIRRPLQTVGPVNRNSAPIRFNSLHGPLLSKPIGLVSNHKKLTPIVSYKDDFNKLQEESQKLDQKLDMDYKPYNVRPMTGDIKSGFSLPALPKPNDFNQAEKQRRLHLLQRKRLDQYNNKL